MLKDPVCRLTKHNKSRYSQSSTAPSSAEATAFTADEQAAGSTAPSSAEATALSDEEKTVVHDDDKISVEFDGATNGSAYGIQDTLYLSFTFTNKTDSELTIFPTDAVINNMSVTLASGIPSTMQANTSVVNSFFVTFHNAGIGSVEDVKNVKLKFTDLSSYTSQDITIDVNQ